MTRRRRARWTAEDWWLLFCLGVFTAFDALVIFAIVSTKGQP